MELFNTAMVVMRFLMLPLVLYNLSWSYKGFIRLVKGEAFPASIYQSTVFFFSLGLAGYHFLAFNGRMVSEWSIPWSLTLQCLFFVGTLTALLGQRVATVVNFEKFYWLFGNGNLDVAVRAAEMNQLDPEFTRLMLEGGETTLSLKLAKKAMSDNDT